MQLGPNVRKESQLFLGKSAGLQRSSEGASDEEIGVNRRQPARHTTGLPPSPLGQSRVLYSLHQRVGIVGELSVTIVYSFVVSFWRLQEWDTSWVWVL